MGDKVRFNQILINLLSNSVKYTQLNGRINFEITDLGTSSSAVENIRFVVSDNGYGISEEFQKVIFAPFTRAESTLVNKKVGSGLGLAIVAGAVQQLGGSVPAENCSPTGLKITILLPKGGTAHG